MPRARLALAALAAAGLLLGAATVSTSVSRGTNPPPGKLTDHTVRHPRPPVAPAEDRLVPPSHRVEGPPPGQSPPPP